jgi:hypothetical protein
MTKADLLGILYERLNYQASPASAVATRLGNMLNQAQRMILRKAGMGEVRDVPVGITFASVSTINYYGLPSALAKVRAITDRTNDRILTPITWMAMRAGDPGLDATGPPYGYVRVGHRFVKYLPVSTGVWAASSAAGDTTQVLHINGIRSGGLLSGDQTATLTGTTRVAIGSFTDYVDVTTVSLSAVGAGLITLYDAAASGTALAEIAIGHLYPSYQGVYLYPTPASAVTYYVDGLTRILDMDDTLDVPVLPEEFHDLLIPATLMLEYEHKDDSRYAKAVALYKDGLSDLQFYLASSPDVMPTLGTPVLPRTSRLGGWYPAD